MTWNDGRAFALSLLVSLLLLALAACVTPPGDVAGEENEFTWRYVHGPDEQRCLILENALDSHTAVMAMDCEWPK